MKSAVETLNPTRVRLTVEVPFAELKPSLEGAYKKIAGQVDVKGFRKGKVPPQIIDQRVGRKAVLEEAVHDALPVFYGKALEESGLQVLGQPEVDLPELVDGADLTFTAEVDIRPDIDLPDYQGIAVTVEDAEVTDAEVDEQLEALRDRFGTLVGVDRAARAEDHVSIDLSGKTKDGQEIPDAQATGLSYVVGSASLVDGLDDAVIGLSAGEQKTFASTLVAGPRKDEEVDIEVTVNSVKVRELPELDDEFAELNSEFDTIDELRADMTEKMGTQKRMMQGGQARDKVLEALLEQVEVPLPEAFLAEEIKFRHQAINNQLAQANLTLDSYLEHEGQSKEEFDADVESRARDGMRAQFVLDAVAKKEEVTVGQEEVTRHLIQRAASSGVTPDQFAQQVVASGQANALVGEVVRSKALALLLTGAKVTDASGREVDLAALRPAGVEEVDEQVEEMMRADAEGRHGSFIDAGPDPDAAPAAESDAPADSTETPGAASTAVPLPPDRD